MTWPVLPVARRRRRQRHRQPVSARRPRRHHDLERWPPAVATKQYRQPAALAHAGDVVEQRKRARRVHRSKAAPAPAAAGSVRRYRDAPARFRSGRHAASRRLATHSQARQSPSARRVVALWPAYHRARHRHDQGLAKASETRRQALPSRTHIVSLPRITPTAIPSIVSVCASESTTIGAKSGFSAIRRIMPSC